MQPSYTALSDQATDNLLAVAALSPERLLRGQQRILEMVASGQPLRSSLRHIAQFAEACVPDMFASILYYDPYRQCLSRGGYGRLPESFQKTVDGLVPGPKHGSCGTCAYLKERVITENVFTDPLWDDFHALCRTYDIYSAWSSPLISPTDRSLLGVFGMYYSTQRVPTGMDLDLVDHFTHLATLAAERHRRDEERRRQAWEDALTGLGNRHLLQAQTGDLLTQHQRQGTPLVLVFLDLDYFKAFNDSFGHHLGDKLLQQVSRRLESGLSPVELLVRFGGDEFIALISAPLQEVESRLRDFSEDFAQQLIQVDHTHARLTLSAGLVDFAMVGWDLAEAIVQADAATREAKHLGRNRLVVVDADHLSQVFARLQISQQMEKAVRHGLINPHGQPIVDLRTGSPVGIEMLFRPSDGVLTGISPQTCITIAEENGLIDQIGMRMLKAACTLLKEPMVAASAMVVNVNLSVQQLMRPNFFATLMMILEEYQIAPNRICLEITESQWLDPSGPCKQVVRCLLDQGFRLALDDFGTGYASLVLLRSLPFHHIKIDRSFIQHLGQNREALAYCKAMIEMANTCQLTVTAEGVETQEQRQILMNLGCLRGQGYLFARPQPEADLPALLQDMTWNAFP
jgi:diguanylate cyclase (GGDEF)-like protein